MSSLNDLEVRKAGTSDRLPIYRMLELYQHDLSNIWDQDLDIHGEYGYALDRYWTKKDCHPFVALVGHHYAGFALVDNAVKVGTSGHWMDQFFILKKYRRLGFGRAMATQVFAELPGDWEVGQMLNNRPAQEFWRGIIAAYTDGNFTEHTLAGGWWEGYVQCFRSVSRE
jgi:predicted acetyltransferase